MKQVFSYGLFLLSLLFLVYSCRADDDTSPLQNTTGEENTKLFENRYLYVLQAGWHTGIVLRTADVATDDWPEVVNYRSSIYVDIGWGDERFYQAEGSPPGLAARAAIIPTSSVIHIVPFNIHPLNLYAGETFLKRIEATPDQFSKLCRIISESFERDEEGRLMVSQINDQAANFYKSRGKYHIFNTCNTWVVRCLQETGFDVNPAGVITQQHLIKALRKLPGGEWESTEDKWNVL
jgi:uncharacterized protein (TIGR02117 family)